MNLKPYFPWYIKIALKLFFARLPLSYHLWHKIGIFRHGCMDRPAYAFDVFRTHYDQVNFARKGDGFIALELGPGDSLFSALISMAFNASCTYLVDVDRYIHDDMVGYRLMADFLKKQNLPVPDISKANSLDDLLEMMHAHYEVKGIHSLRNIGDATVDFIWSHAVLEHVFLDQFASMLYELRRILRPGGACSHRVDLKDHLGGGLNSLRFPSSVWESDIMRRSGFYTNRIRFQEMLHLFEKAGFHVDVIKTESWPRVPLSRKNMAMEFRSLSEDNLLISGFDVLLTPR